MLFYLFFLIEKSSLRPKKQMSQGEVPAQLSESSDKIGYFSVFVLPFILHLGFVAATAFFVMHVQVCVLWTCPQFSKYF